MIEVLDGGKVEPEDKPIVRCLDKPGAGGAHHSYAITDITGKKLFAGIDFQNGAIAENGINGCQQEDLLKIVIHRLECFQNGPFPCTENQGALEACQAALACLNLRTANRRERGVEGKSEG